jgi:hypothetical protein
MPLDSGVLSSLIKTNLMNVGAKGKNLQKFCTAVATGIVISIVNKGFTTSDTGFVPSTGSGTGIGIMALSSSQMKTTALNLMASRGKNAERMMQAIMDAVVSHLSQAASLSSTDFPVYLGTGTIVVGSIKVVAGEMSGNIDTQLQAVSAKGKNRTKLATAIGTGVVNNILSSGTGTLNIIGVPPMTPIPGVGSGTGTIK